MRGVMWSRTNRRWRAVLGGFGKNDYIGEYMTEAEAVQARRAAEIAIHGSVHEDFGILVVGAEALVPLWARGGRLAGLALIDTQDVPAVDGPRWCLLASGYAVARIGGHYVYMHRLLVPGEGVADHISGVKLDNRRANLRRCAQLDNSRNRTGWRNARVPFKGVTKTRGGRFVAQIMVNRRQIYLGRFDTPEEAARAYDAAAAEHFGEFARPNFAAERAGVDVRVQALA